MNKNASVMNISGSTSSTSTHESTSNPPGSVRPFSAFGDSACGEPLLAQHLVVDFTPNEETDTDFVQRKVCAFWQFVDVRPELKDMIVLPETDLFKMSDSSGIVPDVVNHETRQSLDSESLNIERTAVSMLEFVEERGLIYRTFESKLPKSMCSLGSREYHENDVPMDLDKAILQKKDKRGSSYQGQVKYSKRTQTSDVRPVETNEDVRSICRNMRQWDEQHPKSTQCPQNPHSTSHHNRQKKMAT